MHPFGLLSAGFLTHNVINIPEDFLNFGGVIFQQNILSVQPPAMKQMPFFRKKTSV
ncbi:MAG: hypothetical protein RHS_4304 [Robinsoniella sp. RHS]|nr:MAG: hypothetical protein RHS_4304 [Robinsoniella sp. RHS]